MSLFMRLFGYFVVERPSRSSSLEELKEKMADAGRDLQEKLENAPDIDRNRKMLSHIIGIERWSQRRLRVALGDPYIQEEYDDYRPLPDTPWDELKETFERTRQDSVTLADELITADVDRDRKINHNDFGEISVAGWMRYIRAHAGIESRVIR